MPTIEYDGDNSAFMNEKVIPFLKLSDYDKKVMKWVYHSGIEKESDGETGVEDDFMGGMIKSPAGVAHDYINRIENHETPDGKVWTAMQANNFFLRVKKAQWEFETRRKMKRGDINRLTRIARSIRGWKHRWRRWAGVCISIKSWWK